MIAKLSAKIRAFAGDEVARKLAGGGFAALIIQSATGGLTLAMFVLLARAMSAIEYGRFAFGFSLALFLALAATLGQQSLVLRFLSRYLGAHDEVNALAVVKFSQRRAALAASLIALACAGIFLGLFLGGLVDSLLIWIYVGLLIIAYALAEYFSHSLRALGQVYAALAPRDLVWRGAVVAMAGAAVLSNTRLRAEQVLLFCAVTLALVVVAQIRIFRRKMRLEVAQEAIGTRAANESDLLEWKRATPGLALLAIMSQAFQHLFVVATGLVLTTVDAGQFFAAAKIATVLSLPLVAVNIITAPMISHHYHSRETSELQRVCRMAIGLVAPITLASLVILILFGHFILGLFGSGFGAAYPALLVIAFGRLVNALCGPTGMLMAMTGHERRFLVFLAVSNLGGLAALLALAPVLGLTGAAVGMTIAQCGWNVAVWAWARRNLGIDPTALALFRRFLPALARQHEA